MVSDSYAEPSGCELQFSGRSPLACPVFFARFVSPSWVLSLALVLASLTVTGLTFRYRSRVFSTTTVNCSMERTLWTASLAAQAAKLFSSHFRK